MSKRELFAAMTFEFWEPSGFEKIKNDRHGIQRHVTRMNGPAHYYFDNIKARLVVVFLFLIKIEFFFFLVSYQKKNQNQLL